VLAGREIPRAGRDAFAAAAKLGASPEPPPRGEWRRCRLDAILQLDIASSAARGACDFASAPRPITTPGRSRRTPSREQGGTAMRKQISIAMSPLLMVGGLLLAGAAGAQGAYPNSTSNSSNGSSMSQTSGHMGAKADTRHDANEVLKDALDMVNNQMSKDPQLMQKLKDSKGVFLVPDYGRGALVVGGQGGDGVLLLHQNGKWSNPVPFNLGAIDVGLQAGVSAGQVAMILMTDNAAKAFQDKNNFSINADAGLSIVKWSARGQASLGKGDIIYWANTKGLYGGATVSASDITWDDDETRGLYGGNNYSPSQILAGKVSTNDPLVRQLQNALPG
jgi:lipid-binding SYLF domain-containing protein